MSNRAKLVGDRHPDSTVGSTGNVWDTWPGHRRSVKRLGLLRGVSLLTLVALSGCGTVQRVKTITRYKTVIVKRTRPSDTQPSGYSHPRYLPRGVAQISRYDFVIRRGASGNLIQGLCPDKKKHSGAVGAYSVTSLRDGSTYVQCLDPSKLHAPPRTDVMTPSQFAAIQKGEPEGALSLIYSRIAHDADNSGETSFLSTDGHSIYVIEWNCLDRNCDREVVKDKRVYQQG